MIEIQPPKQIYPHNRSIFLAGTIDMGDSINWQNSFVNLLRPYEGIIYNPRRDDWDNSWNKHSFKLQEQIRWELEAMEMADIILYNFLPDSKSPISLLELGLYARDMAKKIIVCCPDEFYRSTNIKSVCEKYFIELVQTEDELII